MRVYVPKQVKELSALPVPPGRRPVPIRSGRCAAPELRFENPVDRQIESLSRLTFLANDNVTAHWLGLLAWRDHCAMEALMLHHSSPRTLLLTLLLSCAGGACSQPAPTQQVAPQLALREAASDPVYGEVAPSADGIGKTYQEREISAVMGWQGAAWLEREEREREERGSLLLQELRLEPGMDVADVGAGTGYYARRMAPLVGPGGKVYAVDVQPEMVAMLRETAARPGLGNIVPVQAGVDDPKLAPGSIDLALMVDVYHELEYPHEVMTRLVLALKPGGRLVFVEYRAEDESVPIKPLHKMSEAQVRREAALHALDWERTADTLPWQHVVVFRKR